DWLGLSFHDFDSIGYHFGWLKESMSMAIGLPKEKGSKLMDAIDAQIAYDEAMGGAGHDIDNIVRDLNSNEPLSEDQMKQRMEELKERQQEVLQRKAEQKRRADDKRAVEMARAQRVMQAFDNKLSAVPYAALLNVRRAVAQIVREKAKAEIDHD